MSQESSIRSKKVLKKFCLWMFFLILLVYKIVSFHWIQNIFCANDNNSLVMKVVCSVRYPGDIVRVFTAFVTKTCFCWPVDNLRVCGMSTLVREPQKDEDLSIRKLLQKGFQRYACLYLTLQIVGWSKTNRTKKVQVNRPHAVGNTFTNLTCS